MSEKYINSDFSKSFSPVIGVEPTILILGTMPGKESLRKQEYYGHPANLFWKIMDTGIRDGQTKDYTEKLRILKRKKIALWDVCFSAVRKGSLDSNIKDEVPNKLHELLEVNKSIKMIGFNGQKAAKLYDKYFDRLEHIYYETLLSTSPANAGYTREQKYTNWESFLLKQP